MGVEALVNYYRSLVRQVFAGRRLIFVCPMASDAAWRVRLLRDCGAEPPLIICSSVDQPVPDAICHQVPIAGIDTDEWGDEICEYLARPPHDLAAALDRYDPDGSAVVFEAPDLESPRLLGRRRYAWRRERWHHLEDKTEIDAFWDRAGVPHAACKLVSPTTELMTAAFRALDQGRGVVVSGDNRSGIWGGGVNVRWARRVEDVPACVSFFAGRCVRVRVKPFMEGIPCSIHGIVFPQGVTVFRPMEIIVLRPRDSIEFLFGGTSLFWSPPAPERDQIRELTRRIGEALRTEAGYRGGFTMDGIMTADGFRPTELNARLGTGIGDGHPLPGLPLFMLHYLAVEDEPVDFRPAELENLVNAAMDAAPYLSSVVPVQRGDQAHRGDQAQRDDQAQRTIWLHDEGGRYRPARGTERRDASLRLARLPTGTHLIFQVEPAAALAGCFMAPRLVSAYACAEAAGIPVGQFGCATPQPLSGITGTATH